MKPNKLHIAFRAPGADKTSRPYRIWVDGVEVLCIGQLLVQQDNLGTTVRMEVLVAPGCYTSEYVEDTSKATGPLHHD